AKYYLKAADQGNRDAEWRVGWYYAHCVALAQDSKLAARYYHRAAIKKFAPAQYSMGTAYREGVGVPLDKVRAYFWIKSSALQGYQTATAALPYLQSEMKANELERGEAYVRRPETFFHDYPSLN
ncbi:MAG: tetratricopeptide repeat protein, partial [Edaphobacter sp.]